MKKEYFKPEMQVVNFSMRCNILAASDWHIGEGEIVPDAKEYNDVSNDNTTNGGTIWDNEW